MKIVKKVLLKILGYRRYLEFVSFIYIRLISKGFLKNKYRELYFLKEIVKPGNTCIDIGANLGYYSYFMSKYAGKNGRVIAIEPVKLFGNIWSKNMSRTGYNNFKLYNYALGKENKTVTMSTPVINGVLHHGMTQISENQSGADNMLNSKVKMVKAQKMFKDFSQIDFVKVDIEGYEHIIFEEIKDIIDKHCPVIQSELSGEENRSKVIEIIKELNYSVYKLKKNKLVLADSEDIKYSQKDFYFLPHNYSV